MKKVIAISISILCILFVFFILNKMETAKIYTFETSILNNSNGRIDYVSKTREFVFKIEEMGYKENIISTNHYGVTIKLNQLEFKKIIRDIELKKYYDSYREYKPLDKIENQ